VGIQQGENKSMENGERERERERAIESESLT